MNTLEQVLQAALALPEEDRALLIDELSATLESAEGPLLDDAWLAEIKQRSQELDAGLAQTIPWEEVRRRTR